MDKKRAEETNEKGRVHANAEGEQSIGEAKVGKERAEDPLINGRAKAIAAAGTRQGRGSNHSVVRCVTWNMRDLRDKKRSGIMGQFLRELGATVVCLQETTWER